MKNKLYFIGTVLLIAFLSLACAVDGSDHDDGDEEEGNVYTFNQTHDETRRGVRLILNYDGDQRAFVGTARNTTASTIECVRVEVHLVPAGPELGPTPKVDLASGAESDIMLTVPSSVTDFGVWSAHPESGCGGDGD